MSGFRSPKEDFAITFAFVVVVLLLIFACGPVDDKTAPIPVTAVLRADPCGHSDPAVYDYTTRPSMPDRVDDSRGDE